MKPAVLLLLAIALSGVAAAPQPDPRGVLDGVIQGIIEGLKPQLVALVLPDIDTHMNASGIIADLTTTNITSNQLDSFTVDELKTTLLPIRLDQLTLHWDEFSLSGGYSLEGDIDLDVLQAPIQVNGEGNASLVLRNLTLKAGATFSSAAGHLQVKQLTQLSVTLGESQVQLENIFEEGSLELIINTFLSHFLPEFLNDFGDQVLKTLEPVIIEKINEVLANVDFP